MQMLLLSTVLFGATQTGLETQLSISRKEILTEGHYLVFAVATKTEAWEIRHVYVGPQNLKGKIVQGEFQPQMMPNAGPTPGPGLPVAVGAGLFWVVQAPVGTISFMEKAAPRVFVPLSALNYVYLYPTMLSSAKVLEKIYLASDDKRLAVIDSIVKSKDRNDSMTALWQIAMHVNKAQVTDYLLELTRDRQLPIAIQIFVHESLEARQRTWLGSPADLEVIEYWVTGAWKETRRALGDPNPLDIVAPDEVRLVQWLSRARERSFPYSRAQLCGFAIKVLANPARSKWLKEELSERWQRLQRHWKADERSEAFAYLKTAVKTRENMPEKSAAVTLLATLKPLSEAEAGQLRELLATPRAVPDPGLRRAIRELLP